MSTKRNLGLKLKNKLQKEKDSSKVYCWLLEEINAYSHIDSEIENIYQYCQEAENEVHADFSIKELQILADLLIKEKEEPIAAMFAMAKENFDQENISAYLNSGMEYLQILLDGNLDEHAFQLAVENFILAINEWDARAFNYLGITYSTWAKSPAIGSNLQEKFLESASKAFLRAIMYNQEHLAYFNLGLASGNLADFKTDTLHISYREKAAYFFNKAIKHGDKKAYGHLAVIYESLGGMQQIDIGKRKRFNRLAIEKASVAITDGWFGCYGTIGQAYLNLAHICALKRIEDYYHRAIRHFKLAIDHGLDGFREDLEYALSFLMILAEDQPSQSRLRLSNEEDCSLNKAQVALMLASKLENPHSRLHYFQKAIHFNLMAIEEGWITAYGALGLVYFRMAQKAEEHDKEIEYYKKALNYLNLAIDNGVPYEYGNKALIYENLKGLASSKKERKRYEELHAETLYTVIQKGLTIDVNFKKSAEKPLDEVEDLISRAEKIINNLENILNKSPFISLTLSSESDCPLGKVITFLADHPQVIELSFCADITMDNLEIILSHADNLVSLNFSGRSNLADDALLIIARYASKLVALQFNNCPPITDQGIVFLKTIPHLKILMRNGNYIS